jgi:hypothetical protein
VPGTYAQYRLVDLHIVLQYGMVFPHENCLGILEVWHPAYGRWQKLANLPGYGQPGCVSISNLNLHEHESQGIIKVRVFSNHRTDLYINTKMTRLIAHN